MHCPLSQEVNEILHNLKQQNSQIKNTLKLLKRTKSQEIIKQKKSPIKSPEQKVNIHLTKPQLKPYMKDKQSKSFKRCTSCQLRTHTSQQKYPISNKKKSVPKKDKENSMFRTETGPKAKKSLYISPRKSSQLTRKYMQMLSNKRKTLQK